MKSILIIGLPGSGKTTLARELKKKLKAEWLNADKVRKKYNNWDFSKNGVLRQAKRMKLLSKKSKKKFVIADFVCPYELGRRIFKPDYLVWMNTIKKGRLSTFDKSFQNPKKFDFEINNKNAKKNSKLISNKILKEFNY
jgi:adenylylsulfate kinase